MLSLKKIILKRKSLLAFIFFLIILNVIIGTLFPYIMKILVDKVLIQRNTKILMFVILTVVGLIAVELCNDFLLSYISVRWSQNLVNNIRNNLYTKFSETINLDTKNNLQTIIISDCEIVGTSIQKVYVIFCNSVLSIIFCISVVYSLSPVMSIFLFLAIPIFFIANLKLSNLSKSTFSVIQRYKDILLSTLLLDMKGFLFIQIYDLITIKQKKFFRETSTLTKANIKYNTIITFMQGIISLLSALIPFMLLGFGSILVVGGYITSGSLIAIFSYSGMIFSPIGQLVSLLPIKKQLDLSISRINALDTEFIERKKNNSMHLKNICSGNKKEIKIINLIVQKKEKNILNGINLNLGVGFYQIKGANGTGKSTLAKIIANLDKIDGGAVILNNINKIQYVPQENFVFPCSIYENLTIGVNKVDEGKLEKLIKVSNFENMDTSKTVSNYSLSTGEIQKIKFIRSLLTEPDVIIFDEIFTNMDSESASSCMKYLRGLNNKLIIFISHEDLKMDESVIQVKKIFLENGKTNYKD